MADTAPKHEPTPSKPGGWAYCTTCGRDLTGKHHLRTKDATLAKRGFNRDGSKIDNGAARE